MARIIQWRTKHIRDSLGYKRPPPGFTVDTEVFGGPRVPIYGGKFSESANFKFLGASLPFLVDIGVQLYQDLENPYLTPGRKFLGRPLVAGVVGLGGGYVVAALVAPEAVIPFLITSFVFGLVVETPVTTGLNEWIFPETPRTYIL